MANSQNPGDTNPMGRAGTGSASVEAARAGRRRGHARDPRPLSRDVGRTSGHDAGRGDGRGRKIVPTGARRGRPSSPAADDARGRMARNPGQDARAASFPASRPDASATGREAGGGLGGLAASAARRLSSLRGLDPSDVADSARSLGTRLLGHKVALVVLVVLVVVAASLYGPVKGYYAARRSGEDLQRRYDELSEKNDSLQGDLKSLTSKEGIEDEARKRGYVQEGETSVTVEGLDSQGKADPSAPVEYQDTRAWPTKALDFVFGYDPEAVWDE
nr:septum formation initiator family protein [uncultured Olsenella sp.]